MTTPPDKDYTRILGNLRAEGRPWAVEAAALIEELQAWDVRGWFKAVQETGGPVAHEDGWVLSARSAEVPSEARRLAILDCAKMVNGRLAGRQEGSDLWLEIIKITNMLERQSRSELPAKKDAGLPCGRQADESCPEVCCLERPASAVDPYVRNPAKGQCKCGQHEVPAGCDGIQWYWQRHGRTACTLELPNERCWCGLLRSEHIKGHAEGAVLSATATNAAPQRSLNPPATTESVGFSAGAAVVIEACAMVCEREAAWHREEAKRAFDERRHITGNILSGKRDSLETAALKIRAMMRPTESRASK